MRVLARILSSVRQFVWDVGEKNARAVPSEIIKAAREVVCCPMR